MYLINTLPYIIFFSLFVILLLVSNINYAYENIKTNKSTNMLAIYSLFLFSIVFIGCRGYVCADWLFYKPFFDKAPSLNSEKSIILDFLRKSMYEKGFSLYVIILKTIFDNYLFLQFVSFLIDVIILHYFFKEYCSEHYFLCWCLYWIFQGFVFEIITIRNTKSIMLFLLSIKYLYQRKPCKYFILNIIGFLFHTSSIIYIPLYFLTYLKRKKKLEIMLFVVGNVVFFLHISWIKNLLLQIAPLISGRLATMLNIYLSNEKFSSAQGISIGLFERTLTFFIFFKYADELEKDSGVNKIFYILFLLYIYTYLFFSEMFIMIERIPNLFVCSYWIIYPKIYGKLKKDWKLLFLIILFLYGVLKTLMLMNMKSTYYDNFLFDYIEPNIRAQYFTY